MSRSERIVTPPEPFVNAESERDALASRLARAEEALETIAQWTDGYKAWTREDRICRAARAALAPGEKEENRG